MGVDGAVEAVAHERAVVVREAVRIDPLALDETGVAVGGLLRDPAPIDERHGEPALLQVQRAADADDARAEHDGVGVSALAHSRP